MDIASHASRAHIDRRQAVRFRPVRLMNRRRLQQPGGELKISVLIRELLLCGATQSELLEPNKGTPPERELAMVVFTGRRV